jgi:hypothetical protein
MPANPLVTTYDPKKVIITYGGTPIGQIATQNEGGTLL